MVVLFSLYFCYYVCVLFSLPHGVVGLSMICDCGIFALTQLHCSVVGRYILFSLQMKENIVCK